MAKLKKRKEKRLEEQKPSEAEIQAKAKKKRRTTIIVASIVVAVILVITGGGIWLGYGMYSQKLFIKVDNESIKMDYFINRAVMNAGTNTSNVDVWGTMQSLVNELIIEQEAPKYVGDVTEAEIDAALRLAYQGDSQSITDAEYKEIYRQNLASSQLTEPQFRAIVRRSILKDRLTAYLDQRVSAIAPQAHLSMIMVMDYDLAAKVKERIDAGENFAVVAQEVSIDSSASNGGDIGWFPYGVLTYAFEQVASNLEIGKCSDPVVAVDPTSIDTNSSDPVPYAVLMVTDRVDAMEMTADQLTTMKGRAFEDWLNATMADKQIEFHGIKKNYDSYTEAWLTYQIQKRMKAMGATSSTTTASTTAQ